MKIKTIIFSKNRACQLETCIRSDNQLSTVIYTHDDEFESGYVKLRTMYPHIEFIREYNDFKQLVIENLGEYTMFLCDDDIRLLPFDEEVQEKFNIFEEFKNSILCLSLRLAPFMINSPEFLIHDYMWEWKGKYRSWGYPMSVTSTIFRKTDILPIIINKEFCNPVELEVVLRNNIPDKPYMICCSKPYFINNLANHIIEGHYRTARQSPESLEEQFLLGKRINIEDLREKAKKYKQCFMVEKYIFEEK